MGFVFFIGKSPPGVETMNHMDILVHAVKVPSGLVMVKVSWLILLVVFLTVAMGWGMGYHQAILLSVPVLALSKYMGNFRLLGPLVCILMGMEASSHWM